MLAIARATGALCAWIGHVLARRSGTPEKLSCSESVAAASLSRVGRAGSPLEALLREAEAQRALAELFSHMQFDALRAIQDLFPLAQRGSDAAEATVH
jgi:hypothetical protein